MRQDLRQRLLSSNQGGILPHWDKLSPHEQSLVEPQLEAIDLEFLANLFAKRTIPFALPDIEKNMSKEQIEKAKELAKTWKANHPPLSFYPDKLGY